MSPSKPGEFCYRCGTKCEKTIQDGKVIYTCPRNHGVQATFDAPKEELPAEGEPGNDQHEGVDDVGTQAQQGR